MEIGVLLCKTLFAATERVQPKPVGPPQEVAACCPTIASPEYTLVHPAAPPAILYGMLIVAPPLVAVKNGVEF